MNQLIEKMTDDMQLRGFSPKTIYAYTSHVKRFEEHFGQGLEYEEYSPFQETEQTAYSALFKRYCPYLMLSPILNTRPCL